MAAGLRAARLVSLGRSEWDTGDPLDLLEDRVVLGDAHAEELVAPVVFVEHLVRVLLELLHVGPDEHLPELDKVAVLLVVDLDGAPGVLSAADLAPVGRLDLSVRPYNRKRDLALPIGGVFSRTATGSRLGTGTDHDLLVFRNRLLVLFVVPRRLVDLDLVKGDVRQNLPRQVSDAHVRAHEATDPLLEGFDLFVGHRVGLCDDGDQVDFGVQSAQKLDVDRLEAGATQSVQRAGSRVAADARVAGRFDKVDAGVDAVVGQLLAVDPVLGLEVRVEPGLDVVEDGLPALRVVDKVAVARRVDDGEPKPYAILLDVCAPWSDLCGRHGNDDDEPAEMLWTEMVRGLSACGPATSFAG